MLVLVTDDSKSICLYLSASIKNQGHDILIANNGLEAIELYKSNNIDLILMDAEMPKCDGFDATKKIRTLQPEQWIPIIFLSAHLEDEYIQKALDCGADVYLRKPINNVELHGQIKAMARISKIRQQLIEANDQLKYLAGTDALTKIANRGCFDERLKVEIEHTKRRGFPLTVLLSDIDFFKPYNDNYGHVAGDECLKKVAKEIDESFPRATDLVARYGGEEFVIILHDTTSIQAQMLAERMRKNIEALQVKHEHSKVADVVTISIGIYTSEGKDSADEIVQKADLGLYNSKENGRNMFSCYKP